jgi:hypothetical protein
MVVPRRGALSRYNNHRVLKVVISSRRVNSVRVNHRKTRESRKKPLPSQRRRIRRKTLMDPSRFVTRKAPRERIHLRVPEIFVINGARDDGDGYRRP